MITVPAVENSATRPSAAVGGDAHGHGLAARVRHLRGDGALPDQVVQLELVTRELAADLVRRAEAVAGRTDRLVRLLRVLHLALVPARLRGHRVGAVELAGLVARGGQRRLRQRRRVGAHVGDVAVLVEALRDAHRLLRREPQLPARLLLQRRRHERRAPGDGCTASPRRRRRGTSAPSSAAASPRASSSASCTASFVFSAPSRPKSRPCATRAPSTAESRAVNAPGSSVATRSQ